MTPIFSPFIVATTAVSVSGTTASGALNLPTNQGSTTVTSPPGNMSVRVYNATSVVVFVKFGTSAVTAATTDMPIPPGGVEIFAVSAATYIAGITAAGTGTLYATPGMGA
jgi:hypothetical protein